MTERAGVLVVQHSNVALALRVVDVPSAAAQLAGFRPVTSASGDVLSFTSDPFGDTVEVCYTSWSGARVSYVVSPPAFSSSVTWWVRGPRDRGWMRRPGPGKPGR